MSSEPIVPSEDGEDPSNLLHGAAKAAALLTVAGVAGQVFTLVRELFVAGKVGVSVDLDALLVAAVAPILLASLLASGTSAAIVPAYLTARRERGSDAAERLLGATTTWTVLIGIALGMLVIAAASLFVYIGGPGLDGSAQALAITYVPLLAPMLVFSAAGSLLAAAFQIHDRMRSIAIAWLAGPVASMIVTILLWDRLGLTALAIGMTVQQATIVVVLVVLALWFHILPPITLRADRANQVSSCATPLRSPSAPQCSSLTCSRTEPSRPSSRPAP